MAATDERDSRGEYSSVIGRGGVRQTGKDSGRGGGYDMGEIKTNITSLHEILVIITYRRRHIGATTDRACRSETSFIF